MMLRIIDGHRLMPGVIAVLVGVVLSSACDDGSTGLGEMGVIQLSIIGLPSGTQDAGSIGVIGDGVDRSFELGAQVFFESHVAAGTYEVTYTPPDGYEVLAGTGVRTVTVVAGEFEPVIFTVSPGSAATGTLRIVVAGVATGTPNRGTIRLTRTTPAMDVTVTIPASGSLDILLVEGSYNIDYTAPGGYELVDGQTDPRSITITENQTATAAYEVQQSATPQNVVFFSDWRTARGNSLQAVTDGGKWDFVSAEFDQTMDIVSSAGLDFPTSNVYRVIATAGRSGWSELRHTSMPVPSVGQSRFYRWYMRVTMPDGLQDDQTHPIQDNYLENWGFIIYNGGGGGGVPNGHWRPEFWSLNSGWPNDRWRGPNLAKNETFRIEMQIQRTGPSTYNMHVRIYDRAGALVVDDAGFRDNANSTLLSTNPTLTLGNVNALNGITAGCNGVGGNAPFPFTYGYQGAFAVCTDSWCGAYTGAF